VRRLFVKTAKFVVGLALVMAVLLKVSTWVFPQDWQLLAAVAVGLAVSRVLARGKVG
jgi:Mg/Co/Ni transporter MgtE